MRRPSLLYAQDVTATRPGAARLGFMTVFWAMFQASQILGGRGGGRGGWRVGVRARGVGG